MNESRAVVLTSKNNTHELIYYHQFHYEALEGDVLLKQAASWRFAYSMSFPSNTQKKTGFKIPDKFCIAVFFPWTTSLCCVRYRLTIICHSDASLNWFIWLPWAIDAVSAEAVSSLSQGERLPNARRGLIRLPHSRLEGDKWANEGGETPGNVGIPWFLYTQAAAHPAEQKEALGSAVTQH